MYYVFTVNPKEDIAKQWKQAAAAYRDRFGRDPDAVLYRQNGVTPPIPANVEVTQYWQAWPLDRAWYMPAPMADPAWSEPRAVNIGGEFQTGYQVIEHAPPPEFGSAEELRRYIAGKKAARQAAILTPDDAIAADKGPIITAAGGGYGI